MKWLRYWSLFLVYFFTVQHLVGQVKLLTLENTLDIVRVHHPIAKQATLRVDASQAFLLSSRGNFDPSYYLRNDRKTFDGKNYFNNTISEIKIPTWYGIDLSAGIENNQGVRPDPTLTVGRSTYVGVSIPVLRGLLMDRRRAAVMQSKKMVSLSIQEKWMMLNDLLYQSASAYWSWVAAHQTRKVFQQAVAVAERRFQFVKLSYLSGDRAAIDTTEALSQLQSMQTMESQAWLALQEKRLELSNYMWNDNGQPYELPEEIEPDSTWNTVAIPNYPIPNLNESILKAETEHPKLVAFDFRREVLQIEKRLNVQELLPSLNLRYNFLRQDFGLSKLLVAPLFENNYKFGIQFGVPLFQREARGNLRSTNIKLNEVDLSLQQTRLEILNKVRASFSEVNAYQTQVTIFQSNTENQRLLLKAEESRFSVGESSMFLVNARENNLIAANQKLIDLKAKFFKSIIGVQWAMGQLR